MSLRKKIVFISILPVVILGVIALSLILTLVKSSMVNEVKDALKGTAAATLAAYDQNPGKYTQMPNGDIWKGDYNISRSEGLVDRLKQNSGMDVTFFYGDKRIMTSAIDKEGKRILGSPAGEKIVEEVLNGGNEYFSKSVSIDGVLTYGYYIPVIDNNEPVGMIFVGTNKAEKDIAINKILNIAAVSVFVIMILCTIVALNLSGNITRRLKASIGIVRTVSKGNLNVEIDEKLTKRKDEIGKLSRAMLTLRDELKDTMTEISHNAQKLSESSEILNSATFNANGSMRQVKNSVTVITESSTEQAENSRSTSENMQLMGENIIQTSNEVEALNDNASIMQNSSQKAVATITELQRINDQVEASIKAVHEQTIRTNESVQKIQDATKLIHDIADETNFLSVNARVEAASAGAAGKGFAVVANQIRDLAIQSNQSSKDIEKITAELMEDSTKAVEIMNDMRKVVAAQNQSMSDTQNIVNEVIDGIGSSLQSIEQIKGTTRKLEFSRNEIMQSVDELTQIAQENAESTHKTFNATNNVADTLEKVANSTDDLKKIADKLVESIRYFHL